MPEILFYHLERAGLEDVLPGLLEKTLERGWKAVVKVGSQDRLEALDSHLWTYKDESFLPHGTESEKRAELQPVLLTLSPEIANNAEVAFFADGTAPSDWSSADLAQLKRLVLLFDGRDPSALEAAREQWKSARATGFETTYWQQSANGKWEKKA